MFADAPAPASAVPWHFLSYHQSESLRPMTVLAEYRRSESRNRTGRYVRIFRETCSENRLAPELHEEIADSGFVRFDVDRRAESAHRVDAEQGRHGLQRRTAADPKADRRFKNISICCLSLCAGLSDAVALLVLPPTWHPLSPSPLWPSPADAVLAASGGSDESRRPRRPAPSRLGSRCRFPTDVGSEAVPDASVASPEARFTFRTRSTGRGVLLPGSSMTTPPAIVPGAAPRQGSTGRLRSPVAQAVGSARRLASLKADDFMASPLAGRARQVVAIAATHRRG